MTRKLVLLRHGQSQWNLDNRFTGWVDVDLTEQGRREAAAAGRLMKEEGLQFDVAHTSVLKRAIHTLQGALAELGQDWLPVNKSWRLNERHYGGLQGLDKAERKRNLRQAFALDDGAALRGLHLALVDDVLTTGATAAALAQLLRRAGAARVDVYCLARTPKPG